jgi:hypothetical protein
MKRTVRNKFTRYPVVSLPVRLLRLLFDKHDPLMAILDPGCTSTLVGEVWLQRIEKAFQKKIKVEAANPPRKFLFGAGAHPVAYKVAYIPVSIGNEMGVFKAFVVPGYTPLLVSKRTCQGLGMILDMGLNCATVRRGGEHVPIDLSVSASGHYVIPLN